MVSSQEMTASPAAAKDASVDAGAAAVSSKLDDIKEYQKISKEFTTTLKAFLPTCFGKGLVWRSSPRRLAAALEEGSLELQCSA